MKKYNLKYLVSTEVEDKVRIFKVQICKNSEKDYLYEGDEVFVKPRVTLTFVNGQEKTKSFKTLEKAKEYEREVRNMLSAFDNWI